MRRRQAVTRSLLLVASLWAISGCEHKVNETEILPWLKVRRTYNRFGGFDGNTQTEYFGKHLGVFWKKLDAYSVAVLNPGTVIVSTGEGASLLRKGEFTAKLFCPMHSFWALPPGGGAVDCVTVMTATDRGRAKQIRFRRYDSSGVAVVNRVVSAMPEGHVLQPPAVVFYDPSARPIFLAITEPAAIDYRVPNPECTLIALINGQPRIISRQPDVDGFDCKGKVAWEKTGLGLLKASSY